MTNLWKWWTKQLKYGIIDFHSQWARTLLPSLHPPSHSLLIFPFVSVQLLPLLPHWLLPRPADGNGFIRSFQGCPASPALPRALHAVAPAHHGLPQGMSCLATSISFLCILFSFLFFLNYHRSQLIGVLIVLYVIFKSWQSLDPYVHTIQNKCLLG